MFLAGGSFLDGSNKHKRFSSILKLSEVFLISKSNNGRVMVSISHEIRVSLTWVIEEDDIFFYSIT